jgi:hypothetical protein
VTPAKTGLNQSRICPARRLRIPAGP